LAFAADNHTADRISPCRQFLLHRTVASGQFHRADDLIDEAVVLRRGGDGGKVLLIEQIIILLRQRRAQAPTRASIETWARHIYDAVWHQPMPPT
jgi:hypothetical protein